MFCHDKKIPALSLENAHPKKQILRFRRAIGISLFALASVFTAQSAVAQTVVYQDDFENGTSGWSNNTTENAPLLGTNFLGRFGGPTPDTVRTFTVPAGATSLDIEFDLLRFDSWDFFNSGNEDGFSILIDGVPLFSTATGFGTFNLIPFPVGQGPRSGTTGNVDWSHVRLNPTDAQVNSGGAQQELGFTTGQFWFDQIHRFTINVNNPGATVELTLRIDTDQGLDDESGGYDNFLVTADTPLPPIDAVDDDFTASPIPAGGITASIFANDDFDGAVPDSSTVDISVTNDGGLTGVTINADGTITIPVGTPDGTYTVTYEICETGTTNCDQATVSIVVEAPVLEADLVTVKALAASSSATPGVGEFVTYEITVMNDGPNAAANVALSDSLPAGLTATVNNGTVTDGTFTNGNWSIPVLQSGDSAVLTLEGTVNLDQGGNIIDNILASPATSDAQDPSTAGDDLTESVTVRTPQPSLFIEKAADSTGPFTVGDVVSYTYTVTNNGDQVVTDVSLTDTHNGSDPAPIPSNERLLTDAGTAGDSTDAAVDGSWDVLAPGDVVTFTGTYTITQTDVENL